MLLPLSDLLQSLNDLCHFIVTVNADTEHVRQQIKKPGVAAMASQLNPIRAWKLIRQPQRRTSIYSSHIQLVQVHPNKTEVYSMPEDF